MMSIGGARDANSFRAAVRASGGLPPPSSLTYQGLFGQHTFYTGGPEEDALVSLATRAGRVPLNSGADAGEDVWVGCFLKSSTDGQPRDATPIDIVAVLDISGSMQANVGQSNQSRLALAQDALQSLLPQLCENDRFGLATFTDRGDVLQTLEFVRDLDLPDLQSRISSLRPGGGTTITAGMEAAVGICKGAAKHGDTRHRRLLFLTDMDDMNAKALSEMVQMQAADSIYVSFIGIGINFNSALAEEVTKHRGANYFCITRAEELKKVVVDDFAFNFFPVAFEVEVAQQSDAFDLVAVYGTPNDTREEVLTKDWQPSTHRFFPAEAKENFKELLLCANRNTGRLPSTALKEVFDFVSPNARTVICADTVFPSAVAADGSVEGGLLLLRLRPQRAGADAGTVRLLITYKTPDSQKHKRMVDIHVPSAAAAVETDPALAKGVMLQRYVEACTLYLTVAKDQPPAGQAERKVADKAAEDQPPAGEAAQEVADTDAKASSNPPSKLEMALQGVESLLADFNADQAKIDGLCPGVREELEKFAKLAQKHAGKDNPPAEVKEAA